MTQNKNSKSSGNKTQQPMTQDAARRIQSNSDKTGNNQGFKQRAQRAASKNK